MTPKKRLNILLADDGSQHAQAAVELLLDVHHNPNIDTVWDDSANTSLVQTQANSALSPNYRDHETC